MSISFSQGIREEEVEREAGVKLQPRNIPEHAPNGADGPHYISNATKNNGCVHLWRSEMSALPINVMLVSPKIFQEL